MKTKTRKSNKIKQIILSLVLIFIISISNIYKYNKLRHIDKDNIDVYAYITIADEVSQNKAQINWKHLCAVTATLNNNSFNKVSEKEITEIANKFINEKNKLYSLEHVINDLDLSKREIKRVYDYIEELEDFGLYPNRLSDDSKYMVFINSIIDGAINNYKLYKILPSITIAQAILETGWGESTLSSKYNNLFGIKADIYWEGDFVTLETKEFSNTIIDDKFRKYNDKNDSINDHGKFLYENNRYQEHGVFDSNTYTYQAKALQEAGYSTHMNDEGDKIYASQLIEIIRQYNLQLIDSELQELVNS